MALAVLGVLVGAYAFGSRKARQASDLESERRRADDAARVTNEVLESMGGRNETAQAVSSLSDDAAYDELRGKWSRKD